MKRRVWGAVLLAGASLAGAQQGGRPDAGTCGDPAVTAAVQEVVDAWKDGYNGGDPARVGALYSEDAYYLTQHFVTGILHGRAAIQAYVQRGIDAHYRIDALRVLDVGCSGAMAYVITRYDATNDGQAVFGVNLVVLRRVDGAWKIVAHEAAVPDVATAVKTLGSRDWGLGTRDWGLGVGD